MHPKVSKGRTESPLVAPAGAKSPCDTKAIMEKLRLHSVAKSYQHTKKTVPLCGGNGLCLLDVCVKKTKRSNVTTVTQSYLASAVASVPGMLMISSMTNSAASPRRGPSLYIRV